MPWQPKMLGQLRPADASIYSIYSPPANTSTVIKQVVVCVNDGNTASKYRIYLDDDGTTYDETTALVFNTAIAAEAQVIIDVYWPMADSAGNLAVRADTGNVVTFTVFGDEWE